MSLRRLFEPVRGLANIGARSRHVGQSFLTRSMATTTTTPTIKTTLPPFPGDTLDQTYADATLTSAPTQPILEDTFSSTPTAPIQSPITTTAIEYTPPPNPFLTPALTLIHQFPSMEPSSYANYPQTALLLPLRRDILHRAVIFEGDRTRQGTASTKWRGDVHGSNRKIRPQKGTGRARLGDKKSPMLKGGGVAHGPHPRDFSTGLPRKIYDLAFRTALSYRYRKGQLVVTEKMDIRESIRGPGSARWMNELLTWHGWGKEDGKTTFITNEERASLKAALENPAVPSEAQVLVVDDVDVKDLLKMGRLVIEKDALNTILKKHSSDLHERILIRG